MACHAGTPGPCRRPRAPGGRGRDETSNCTWIIDFSISLSLCIYIYIYIYIFYTYHLNCDRDLGEHQKSWCGGIGAVKSIVRCLFFAAISTVPSQLGMLPSRKHSFSLRPHLATTPWSLLRLPRIGELSDLTTPWFVVTSPARAAMGRDSGDNYIYIYIYIYTHTHAITYTQVYLPLSLSLYIYIYIYIYNPPP